MKLANGQTLLFTGDSITDCGRDRPLGEGSGLGHGYVALVDNLLAATYPQTAVRVLNTGISGNRVTDLERRWPADILDHKPDWLAVMIGINDVWRQFDSGQQRDQVDSGRFGSTYRHLLNQARPKVSGLALMTPFFIEANRDDPMRAMMDQYSTLVERLAGEFDAVFVDVQAAFDRYLVHRPSQSLADDRVHPNPTGHMIIARAFLTAMGFQWAVDK